MASRVKEEEKNERLIRGLLKLPENRRCINCNSLGPQYVCTNFWTFVCTTCSGIHREFTHRIKSVSMAKFTTQEVAALQERGNQHAREIYLKELDSKHQSGPDGSNVERLREFIKHVYVDRRYTGERSSGKPPSTKMAEKGGPYENRRSETYETASRSPPYEDAYERRYSEMSSPGARSDNSRYSYDDGKSPGRDQESQPCNNFRRSPAHPEIVNDWRREDRFGNGWKGEDRRISDVDSKLESRSPERPKEVSSPPVVRPVREILGDNAVTVHVVEPTKANTPKVATVSPLTQITSSSSLGSANENRVEVKVESIKSLIDFDDDPEPPAVGTMPHVQEATQRHSVTQPAIAPIENNWASFDFGPQFQVSQAPNIANPLESVLSQLSVSSSVPSHVPAAPGGSSGSTALPANILGQASATPVNGGLWPSVLQQQQQTSVFPALGGQSTLVTSSLSRDPGNQPQDTLVGQNVKAAYGIPSSGAPPVLSTPAPAVTSVGLCQAADIKPSGRKELPEDLFTSAYSFYPASIPRWHSGPSCARGYSMQYPGATVLMPTFIPQSKSLNPFDVSEPAQSQVQGQAHNFPSRVSLQGALPNIPPSGLHRTSSLGSSSPAWMAPQSSTYPSVLPSHRTAYTPGMPARPYLMQQLPNNLPLRGIQVMGDLGVEGASLGALHMDQQASRFSNPATTQPFSSLGGNPFG